MITNGTYPLISIVASLATPNYMQVSSVSNGVLSNGLMVGGQNVPANMFITGQLSGAPGGPGLYTVGCYPVGDFSGTKFPVPLNEATAPGLTLASQAMLVAPWTVNVEETIISQYANSPTLLSLLNNINQCIDPQVNLFNFYNQVWNVNTAVGYGLDLWGRIVGVSRLISTNQASTFFNFYESLIGTPFGPGGNAPFLNGAVGTGIIRLDDPTYQNLILAKALANISICSIPIMNKVLTMLFGTGVSVVDYGSMQIQINVTGNLTPIQLAILNFSGVIPRPAGVMLTLGFNTQTTVGTSSTFTFNITGLITGTVGTSGTVTVSVSPTSASVAEGATQVITATVTGNSNTAVTWTTTGGTITPIPNAPTIRNSYFIGNSNVLSGVSVVAGDLIVVGISYGNSPASATCTDTSSGGSNTYNSIGGSSPAFNDASLNGFYAVAKNTETLTITANVPSTNYQGMQVLVVQGCTGTLASVLDAYVWDTVEGSTSINHTSGSLTTTSPNDILFTFVVQGYSAGTGWTEGNTGFTNVTNAEFFGTFTNVATTTGSYTDNFNYSNATYAGSLLMAFKSAGGTGNSALFTAPGTTGTCTVTATSAVDPTKSANSVMTITGTSNAVTSVTLSPSSLSVIEGATSAPVTATVNYTGTVNTTVTWSLSGGGTLTNITGNSCTILAGTSTGPWTLTATSVADGSKTANITVTVAASGGAMSITMTAPTQYTAVGSGGTVTFAAVVTGNANTSVNWSVDGVAGGNSTVGLINTSGVYTCPTTTTPTLHTITATAAANSAYTAVMRVLATNGNTTYNAKTSYGATGNGSTDDTTAISNALTAAAGNICYLPAGTYMINATLNVSGTTGLDVPANTCLYLASGATLQCITQTTSGQYRVVRLATNNSSVVGGSVIGDRVARNLPSYNNGSGTDFENGDGIDLNGATGNVVFGVATSNNCCDGVYIYNNALYWTVSDVTSNNNRRQGLSVVAGGGSSGTNAFIRYSTFSNTNGNDPGCGIDLENSGSTAVSYITIDSNTFTGNKGGGLAGGSGNGPTSYITVTNNTFTNNGGQNYGIGGIYFNDGASHCTFSNNTCTSNVAGGNQGGIVLSGVSYMTVNNNICNSNAGYGIVFSSCGSGTTFYHGNTTTGNTSGTIYNDGTATAD